MKRAIATALFLALLLPQAAWADREFRFFGGGFGHGVGMSQYGAFGLAKKGWSRSEIVKWYYVGTALDQREPPKSSYRVGLLQRRRVFTLRASNASARLVMENSGDTVETIPQGGSRKVVIAGGQYKIYSGDTLKDTVGSSDNDLRVIYGDTNARVKIVEWGHRVGRGRLEFEIVASDKAHLVTVVNSEEYLYGLAEVPSSWPMKVLEVQADAGRTYAYTVVGGGGRTGCACDIYGDTRDQHYTGWDKEAGTDGDRWRTAVQNTTNQVVEYGGDLARTFYSSSSGGWIEAVSDVWGSSYPYLKARCDPGDYVSANPSRTWKSELMGKEAGSRLRSRRGWNIRRVTSIAVTDRGRGGYVSNARVYGINTSGNKDSWAATGEQLRTGLSLKSARFWVNNNRFVKGAIRTKYDNIRCRPGLPRSGRRSTNGGVWQRFANGRIYSKDGPGTHYVRGLILRKYLDKGGPGGRLGYPKTDVFSVDADRDRTRFQGGVITCNHETRRCRVRFT